jgi:hypothetical protein
MTDDQREAFEERAAILEFDAGMKRADAERKARDLLDFQPEDMPCVCGRAQMCLCDGEE